MKKAEIKVDGCYSAKVSGKRTILRVKEIVKRKGNQYRKGGTCYVCENLKTGRTIEVKSAMRFSREVSSTEVEELTAPKQRTMTKQRAVQQNAPYERKEGLAAVIDTADDYVGPPHLMVKAYAGTGKTTTMVEGARSLVGEDSELIPSDQQQDIWNAIRKTMAEDIHFVAFGSRIAKELKQRVPGGTTASTMHSLGNGAVRQAFPRLGWRALDKRNYCVQDHLALTMGIDSKLVWKQHRQLLKVMQALVGKCKQNLIGHAIDIETWDSDLTQSAWDSDELKDYWMVRLGELAEYYDINLNGVSDEVFEYMPKVLESMLDPTRTQSMTFDDQIWLPVILSLPVPMRDLLLIDEAQDLNRAQQELAKMVGRILVFVGDPNQAIYGFAGADTESMPRLRDYLKSTPQGCVELPLTVTRRCGKAIVKEAQAEVPDFEAHPDNHDGLIRHVPFKDQNWRNEVEAGDMILARVNAPLISECFKYIKEGRKANIVGRSIGDGLISLIKKLKADSVTDLITKLDEWYELEQQKENAKKHPREDFLVNLEDKYSCLMVFASDDTCSTVEDVAAKIEQIFTDDDIPGIVLSSIHKAKGLEARRVIFMRHSQAPIPHPMAKTKWAREQERHLIYVAKTRAIEELWYVE